MKYTMNKVGLTILIAFIVSGIYDFGLVVFTGVGGTISNAMVSYGIRSPYWVLVAGITLGHLMVGMHAAICPKCGYREGDKK